MFSINIISTFNKSRMTETKPALGTVASSFPHSTLQNLTTTDSLASQENLL